MTVRLRRRKEKARARDVMIGKKLQLCNYKRIRILLKLESVDRNQLSLIWIGHWIKEEPIAVGSITRQQEHERQIYYDQLQQVAHHLARVPGNHAM